MQTPPQPPLSPGDRVFWRTSGPSATNGRGIVIERLDRPQETPSYRIRVYLHGHDTGRDLIVAHNAIAPASSIEEPASKTSPPRTPGHRRPRRRDPP